MSRSKIRIVLDEPSHPGNIGAAARAMKTMGLHDLYLVRPEAFPSEEADSRAVSAVDILNRATVVDELGQATGDCQLVVGVSGRQREWPLPPLSARDGGRQIVREAATGAQVAVVFGTESTGLTNEALDSCTYQLFIPTNPEFKSLNLSAAVQLVCYEIWMGELDPIESDRVEATSASPAPGRFETPASSSSEAYPSQEEIEFFFRRLESTLEDRNFYHPQNPDRVNLKLRRLIARARPKDNELRLLHSLVGLMQEKASSR